MRWIRLGAVAPGDLVAARAEAHHAAQVIAAAGETHLPAVPDTSHTALTWDAAHRALVGRPLPGELRLGLRVADLALLVLDRAGGVADARALAGETLEGAKGWAAGALGRRDPSLARPLRAPDYELPAHALGKGAAFEAPGPALEELARWYADADAALRELAARTEGAGEVLAWPHHFDIATLVVLGRDARGEATRTVGVGLSPGDEFIGMPYWYVNHWPTAEGAQPGELAAGAWFTEGWTGAVLRADELVAAGEGEDQAALLEAFLASAVAENRKLLG